MRVDKRCDSQCYEDGGCHEKDVVWVGGTFKCRGVGGVGRLSFLAITIRMS